jgi:rhodanese-related sulfurtransferase
MDTSKFFADNMLFIGLAFASGAMLIWPLVKTRAAGPAVNAFEATRLVNREKGVFVDVREGVDFAMAHITGSVNIAAANLKDGAKNLPKDKTTPVIVVCANGQQSAKAAAELRASGYTRAVVLAGGIAGWRDAQMPVEKLA